LRAFVREEEVHVSRWIACGIAVIVALTTTPPLRAHHSFGAEYDGNQPIILTGVVTKIEWTNPHSFLFIDVVDSSGNTVNWKLEGYPPSALSRTGWKRDVSIKVGDMVTVSGWRSRLGGTLAHSREVTLADGKHLFFGPPGGTGDGGAAAAVKAP
jgi:hypothetical protein